MARPKLGRLCSMFKDRVRSRLSSSALTSRRTSTPRRPRSFTPIQEDEKFQRIVDIAIRKGENSQWSNYTHGIALFDTGSEYNLVTSRFLNSIRVKWQPSTSSSSIFQMDGTEIEILGEVQGTWWPVNAPSSDNFPPRYQMCTFKVVDLENCELIIGRVTINQLKLLQPNPTFFGAFRGPPIHVDPTSITKEKQKEVYQKKQKEQEDVKKFEEEWARKTKAPDPQLR